LVLARLKAQSEQAIAFLEEEARAALTQLE
jgi:hypothetical protein